MNTICFGQQPCGFFPKRFLVAKINTARALQKEAGGRIVFFYHDSDADYRETITVMKDKQTGAEVRLNFLQPNKIQKKFSPLYTKTIAKGWKEEMLKQLPRFVDENLIDIFMSVNEKSSVADFCLEMYKKMGFLEGIEVVRSSDKDFREKALDLDKDYFVDVQYEGETVRSQLMGNTLKLHEGGGKYLEVPLPSGLSKQQKNPNRDQRFSWMNSVIKCTHYIAGNAEFEYLKKEDFPEVKFIQREQIENSEYAFISNN